MSAATIIGALTVWAGVLLIIIALCKLAAAADEQAHDALDEQQALDNLRPLSHAVTREPPSCPVVALMREGLTADDAVRETVRRSIAR